MVTDGFRIFVTFKLFSIFKSIYYRINPIHSMDRIYTTSVLDNLIIDPNIENNRLYLDIAYKINYNL